MAVKKCYGRMGEPLPCHMIVPFDSKNMIVGELSPSLFTAGAGGVTYDPPHDYGTHWSGIPGDTESPADAPHLPLSAVERKGIPLATGVVDYFPDALVEVAELSRVGNDQHNPGQPLHWAKDKSTDHSDALMRHMLDRGTRDADGVRHSTKVAWRALALLQTEIENERKKR